MCNMPAPQVQPPWLSLVGLGADGWDGLSEAARQAVREAALLIGGARHLSLVPKTAGQERMAWPSPLHDAYDTILSRRGAPVCVLASGDPFWHGIGATLARRIDPAEMRVFPGASAFSLAAARMGWALQEMVCVSVHGRALERVIPHLHDGARLLVLSWDGTTPSALAELLTARGFGESTMTVLAQMGGPEEQRFESKALGWMRRRVPDLNTIAVECRGGAEARIVASVAGRAEDAFAHDGQITKREVRAVTLAMLAPGQGELLWDVGAGCGSIAVEWMLSHASNHAVAVEARAERAQRIGENARAFGVPGLRCMTGRAPEALSDLEPPDAVFIGGGVSGDGVFDACWSALKPGGRVVANSVTLEGEAVLAQAAERFGGELVRLNVSRAEPLGRFSGWAALRPVTIWKGLKP